jgi:hypothetical protein
MSVSQNEWNEPHFRNLMSFKEKSTTVARMVGRMERGGMGLSLGVAE